MLYIKDPMESARDQISVPIMENFMADVGDGCSLAVLLSFYCPQIVKIEGKTSTAPAKNGYRII